MTNDEIRIVGVPPLGGGTSREVATFRDVCRLKPVLQLKNHEARIVGVPPSGGGTRAT